MALSPDPAIQRSESDTSVWMNRTAIDIAADPARI
jgi:hypothetical protein